MTRADLDALQDLKRAGLDLVRLDRMASTLREIVGTEVKLLPGRLRAGPASPLERGVAVLLAPADTPTPASGALVEVEGTLAANVASRVLRRTLPAAWNEAGRPSTPLAGALAAVLLAAARRAHAGEALRIVSAGPAAPVGAEFALDAGLARATLSLTVIVGQDAFSARVTLARGRPSGLALPAWDATTLERLGPLPLSVPVVVAACVASPAELASLRRGDALRLGASATAFRARGPAFAGPVLLAAPCASLGMRAELRQEGTLVLRGGLEPVSVAEAAAMEPEDKGAVVATIGDVPVEVRVEIGEATMTARDWASLGRGDVVPLGRRVGEPVLLRVGGVLLARGELVDLDGEVAVRVLERLGSEVTA